MSRQSPVPVRNLSSFQAQVFKEQRMLKNGFKAGWAPMPRGAISHSSSKGKRNTITAHFTGACGRSTLGGGEQRLQGKEPKPAFVKEMEQAAPNPSSTVQVESFGTGLCEPERKLAMPLRAHISLEHKAQSEAITPTQASPTESWRHK